MILVASMSRGVSGNGLEGPEMPGNKREQNATRCDMKTGAAASYAIEKIGDPG
jgi:hypothetical protein